LVLEKFALNTLQNLMAPESSGSESSLICSQLIFYGFNETHDVPKFNSRVSWHVGVL